MHSFKKALEELGISLPKHVYAFESKDGIRVASKSLMRAPIKGRKGILAYANDRLTHSFILAFGSLASSTLEVGNEGLALAHGSAIPVKARDGLYVALYKGFPLCLVNVKEGKAYPSISKGFKRKVINHLKD